MVIMAAKADRRATRELILTTTQELLGTATLPVPLRVSWVHLLGSLVQVQVTAILRIDTILILVLSFWHSVQPELRQKLSCVFGPFTLCHRTFKRSLFVLLMISCDASHGTPFGACNTSA